MRASSQPAGGGDQGPTGYRYSISERRSSIHRFGSMSSATRFRFRAPDSAPGLSGSRRRLRPTSCTRSHRCSARRGRREWASRRRRERGRRLRRTGCGSGRCHPHLWRECSLRSRDPRDLPCSEVPRRPSPSPSPSRRPMLVSQSIAGTGDARGWRSSGQRLSTKREAE